MLKKEIKILFLGTPEISAKVLERLILDEYNVVGVVSQVDREKDKKHNLLKTATKSVAEKYNIPCYQFEKIRDNVDFIKEINPDLILTLAYGQIISQDILDIPRFGCLNLHGSLLPKYRGASPMQFAILNGEKVSGVTLMEMVKAMDAGRMFAKKEINIEKMNYSQLYDETAKIAYEVFDENIQAYIDGNLLGEEQDENLVTFTRKLTFEDEALSFTEDATSVHNRIRAFSMNIGAHFTYKDLKIKVYESEVLDINSLPGEIVEYNKNKLVIGCKNGALLIKILQKPGKKLMNIRDFYNGNRDFFVEKTNIYGEN